MINTREDITDKVRHAVLAALDETLGGRGWEDADLPALFRALDDHLDAWEKRNSP